MLGVPPFFKEIFDNLPDNLSDLISWREMLAEVATLSNRLLTGKGSPNARTEFTKISDPQIILTDDLTPSRLEISHGEKILKIYFWQIMHADNMFLDLRPKRFASIGPKLTFKPNGLWASLDSFFAEGIRMVYKGYYNNDDSLFAEGLEKSGLVKKEWEESKKNEVIEVFKKHFSNGRGEKITFTMNEFKSSFTQIFKTLVKNKIKLDKNFLHLGIMLVTLYKSLDEIGGAYDVSKIFKESL